VRRGAAALENNTRADIGPNVDKNECLLSARSPTMAFADGGEIGVVLNDDQAIDMFA